MNDCLEWHRMHSLYNLINYGAPYEWNVLYRYLACYVFLTVNSFDHFHIALYQSIGIVLLLLYNILSFYIPLNLMDIRL